MMCIYMRNLMSSIFMRSVFILGILSGVWGCIEEPAVPVSEMTPDLAPSDDDRGVPEEVDQDPPLEPDATPTPEAPPELGWLEVTLSPQQTRYRLEETIEITWLLFDVYGREISDEAWRAAEVMAPIATYEVDPPTLGRIEEGSLTLLEPGVGQLEVCVAELCERVSLIVDNGPPRVELLTPTQGSMLGGEEGDSEISPTIQVSGSVTDGALEWVTVTLNDQLVELDESGAFQGEITPQFGVNSIQVTAYDELTGASVSRRHDVLWAPRYIPHVDGVLQVPDLLKVRIDQVFFDTDQPRPELTAGILELEGLAQLIEVVLSLSTFEALSEIPALGEEGGLSVSDVSLGDPEVDFWISAEGLEFYLYFPDVTLQTQGEVELEGQLLNLNGALELALAARVGLSLEVTDRFRVEVGESQVHLESLRGSFEAVGFEALINALSDRLLETAETAFNEAVEELLREQLGGVLQDALLDLFGDLRALEFELPSPLDAEAEPRTLSASLYPVSVDLQEDQAVNFSLNLDLTLNQAEGVRDAGQGLALLRESDPPTPRGAGLGFSFEINLLNAVLYELWRSDLLTLSPPVDDTLSALISAIEVEGLLPPVIIPNPLGSDQRFTLQLGGFVVKILKPNAPLPDEFLLSLQSGLTITVIDGQLRMTPEDAPEIDIILLEAGSDAPFPEALIAGAITSSLWPTLQEAFTDFSFDFGSFEIDASSLSEFSDRIAGLSVALRLDETLETRAEQVAIEGSLEIALELEEAP